MIYQGYSQLHPTPDVCVEPGVPEIGWLFNAIDPMFFSSWSRAEHPFFFFFWVIHTKKPLSASADQLCRLRGRACSCTRLTTALKLSCLPPIRFVPWASERASERAGWPPLFSASFGTRCSPVCLGAEAAPALPFSPSSSVTHTNHAPLQSITTEPSSVLLQPRPPIVLSSTHPLHQSPLCHGRCSLAVSEVVDRFAATVAKALPIVAAVLVLLLHPHFISFFFFFIPLRQSKKEAIVLGGVKEDRGRFVSTKGGLRLVERDATHSQPGADR